MNEISLSIHRHRKSIFQLPTGGGKTVTFAAICDRYTRQNDKSVLIVVHRKELLKQAIRSLHKFYQLHGQPIVAGMKIVPRSRIYVAMVDSLVTRLPQLRDVGLVIIDECHIGNFKKLHQHFASQYIIGFTATPMAATKKDPLKNYYNDIVCGPQIEELIKSGALVQNMTYNIKGISRDFGMRGDDFDEGMMGAEFSKLKHIKNTVQAYEKHAKGTKAIVFNCNVRHSLLVTQAFIDAGYPAAHIDGETPDDIRDATLATFAETPGMILCNVDITTTGYDEPSIETVIMNRSTLSICKWLQCCGRGSRLYEDKLFFTIIDLGGNALAHGDWCDPVDWREKFFNPPKKKKDGVAPVKDCPQCEAVVHASARICKYCGFEFPVNEIKEDSSPIELTLITRNIDLPDLIEKSNNARKYNPFYQIGNDIAEAAKINIPMMTDELAAELLEEYHKLAREYIHTTGKKYLPDRKLKAKNHLYSQLQKRYPAWRYNSHTMSIIQGLNPLGTLNMKTF